MTGDAASPGGTGPRPTVAFVAPLASLRPN